MGHLTKPFPVVKLLFVQVHTHYTRYTGPQKALGASCLACAQCAIADVTPIRSSYRIFSNSCAVTNPRRPSDVQVSSAPSPCHCETLIVASPARFLVRSCQSLRPLIAWRRCGRATARRSICSLTASCGRRSPSSPGSSRSSATWASAPPTAPSMTSPGPTSSRSATLPLVPRRGALVAATVTLAYSKLCPA